MASIPSYASETYGLKGSYEVEINILGSDQASIKKGMLEGLKYLVLNISGSSDDLDKGKLKKLLKDPQQFVTEYRLKIDKDKNLKAYYSFEGDSIRQLLIANGLPLLLQLYLQFTSNEIYNVLPWEFMAAWMASLGVMIFGLILRGCSIPEVCCPGYFDYIGHSHGYWHLCINGGFSVMLVGIQKYLAFRSVHVCPENKIDWCNNATWISVNGTTGNMTHVYF